jgi:hypothetical protein
VATPAREESSAEEERAWRGSTPRDHLRDAVAR